MTDEERELPRGSEKSQKIPTADFPSTGPTGRWRHVPRWLFWRRREFLVLQIEERFRREDYDAGSIYINYSLAWRDVTATDLLVRNDIYLRFPWDVHMTDENDNFVEIDVRREASSENAILVYNLKDRAVWLPKRLIECEDVYRRGVTIHIRLPEWLAKKHEFI